MKTATIGDWVFTGDQEIAEGAEYLENDAAFLASEAQKYRDKGNSQIADIVLSNSVHSANCAAQLRKALENQ